MHVNEDIAALSLNRQPTDVLEEVLIPNFFHRVGQSSDARQIAAAHFKEHGIAVLDPHNSCFDERELNELLELHMSLEENGALVDQRDVDRLRFGCLINEIYNPHARRLMGLLDRSLMTILVQEITGLVLPDNQQISALLYKSGCYHRAHDHSDLRDPDGAFPITLLVYLTASTPEVGAPLLWWNREKGDQYSYHDANELLPDLGTLAIIGPRTAHEVPRIKGQGHIRRAFAITWEV